jgi:2-C-methyl-D-erythritol 4-phosphate cytidylyltransferase/2-C-methyl-D-erythritol 2,4-cyclodiphosphate synthase
VTERYWLIVPAAGRGERFGSPTPKQYLMVAGRTVLEHAITPFLNDGRLEGVVVALAPGDQRFGELEVSRDPRVRTVTGGAARADSVRAALEGIAHATAGDPWVLVHDAVRPCLSEAARDRLVDALARASDGALLAIPVADTLKRASDQGDVDGTVARDGLWQAQTPQAFRLATLRGALSEAPDATDESVAAERKGLKPQLVQGEATNVKVTRQEDLTIVELILRRSGAASREAGVTTRIGFGFDVHGFGPGDSMWLGGVRISHDHGVIAHSDGDVLLHALCDALLGAAGLGDVGELFPDTNPHYRGISSGVLVEEVRGRIEDQGYAIGNVDLTLIAEAPRLAPHRDSIRASIAMLLGVHRAQVSVKATTTEALGFLGRGEGIAAQAAVLLYKP